MEFMVAYFPIIKFLIFTIGVLIIGGLAFKEYYKLAIGLTVIFLLVAVYSPIKYDGTGTRALQTDAHIMTNRKYNNIDTSKVLVSPKQSFERRMEIEEARSRLLNAEVKQEIEGN